MSDKSLTSCMYTFGEESGIRFYKLCQQAVKQLKDLSECLDINPYCITQNSLYYASTDEHVPLLREEYEKLTRHGFPVQFLEQDEVERMCAFSRPAALLTEGDAEINPYRMVYGLLQQAVKRGLRVYEHTPIIRHHFEANHAVCYTVDGYEIRANKVVFATGYETQEFHHNTNAYVSSTYAIATQPLDDVPGWPGSCMIWETARPYLYMRKLHNGRIIIGGLDEKRADPKTRDSMLLGKRDKFLRILQEMFPGLPKLHADYYWSGAFGSTHDGYPLIGEQPEFPHCYFALGYGGNGTVYSMIACNIIHGLITSGHHPDARLFAFTRSSE